MSILQKAAEAERKGEAVAVATIIRSKGSVPRHDGSKMLIFPDGRTDGTIGGGTLEAQVFREALDSLEDGETRVLTYAFRNPEKGDVGICGGELTVFIEPFDRPRVVVVGGGHVGKAVAECAHWLGFRVVVTDDRAEFVTPEAIPEADEHISCALAELPDRTCIGKNSYVVLTTRGVPIDVAGLPALFSTPAAYIGVIGSRRRWEICAKQLLDDGATEEASSRVTSPIGLDLNAESPEEIALSVMAEILMLRRDGSGERMRHTRRRTAET